MFTTIIVQPIFNLLVLIYALLPGHNFGLSLIFFTILIRILLWPLIKKQLHHTKIMRQIQPELKRIKAATKGNRQQESIMMMELYRERGINPFASFGLVLVQLPILIALYSGINKIVHDPRALVDFSYPFIRDLPWMKTLAEDIGRFDNSLFGLVDLGRSALGQGGAYWPAMVIVVVGTLVQFYQSKQLLPDTKKSRKLRDILRDAGAGKQADQTEVNAAVGRSTLYLIPAMIFIFTVNIASALSLYFLVSGLTALVQQSRVLGKDEDEMEIMATETSKTERKVVPSKIKTVKKVSRNKKRRRK